MGRLVGTLVVRGSFVGPFSSPPVSLPIYKLRCGANLSIMVGADGLTSSVQQGFEPEISGGYFSYTYVTKPSPWALSELFE